jgi:radical SAM protein (TIGR01212 family)
MPGIPYNEYSKYLKRLHGRAVKRIAVDAGFSCPNRPGGRTSRGCVFCSESGSRALYQANLPNPAEPRALSDLKESIAWQIRNGISRAEAWPGDKAYSLYFQAYSSTFAPIARLKEIYDFSLSQAPFAEMVISTRPDCVTPEIAELISGYRRWPGLKEVWVELGLQSAHDRTLQWMRRGHDVACFDRAVAALRTRGLKCATHLILGLPGETEADAVETARHVARMGVDGVKFHDLHVTLGTELAEMAERGEVSLIDEGKYLETLIAALEILPKETVVMRLCCDTKDSARILPKRQLDKAAFRRALVSEMERRRTWQGRLAPEA